MLGPDGWFPSEIDTKESHPHLFQLRYAVCVVIRVEVAGVILFYFALFGISWFRTHEIDSRLSHGGPPLFAPPITCNCCKCTIFNTSWFFCWFFSTAFFFWLLHLHFKFLFVWQLFQIVICYCLEFILLLRLGNVCQPHVPPPPTHAATHN